MPNYVINNVVFETDDEEKLNKIFEAIKGDEEIDGEIPCIDFNKIIPMPESLNIEAGSRTDNAIEIYLTKNKSDNNKIVLECLERANRFHIWRDNLTDEEIAQITNRSDFTLSDALKIGEIAINNIINYGAKDWYDWCRENWGTKWNACYCQKNRNTITFQTAWSCPQPVLKELSKKFNADLTVEFADEDIGGGNCGSFTVENGEILDMIWGDEDDAARFWGYDDAQDYYGE